MSVVVLAASPSGAAIAADSLHYDLVKKVQTVGYAKITTAPGRVAGFAGLSDINGHSFIYDLHAALDGAERLDDLPELFRQTAGMHLYAGYRQWSDWTGLRGHNARQYLEIVAADMRSGHCETTRFMFDDTGSDLVPVAETLTVGEPIIEAAGAVDGDLLALTRLGQLYSSVDALRIPAPAFDWPNETIHDLETVAGTLVQMAIDREPQLPRAPQLPEGVPQLAGPALIASTDTPEISELELYDPEV